MTESTRERATRAESGTRVTAIAMMMLSTPLPIATPSISARISAGKASSTSSTRWLIRSKRPEA